MVNNQGLGSFPKTSGCSTKLHGLKFQIFRELDNFSPAVENECLPIRDTANPAINTYALTPSTRPIQTISNARGTGTFSVCWVKFRQ